MVGRGARPPAGAATGRHALSPRLAAEFVQRLHIRPDEVVVEIGAGAGRLTKALCDRARLVLASELDPVMARGLLAIDRPNLFVHRGDAIGASVPGTAYRVVGNAPFGIGTALLRRFLDDGRVTRLDLILQREAARKRAGGRGSVLAVRWGVDWRIDVPQAFPRSVFHPPPRVDGAWLRAVRRARPLLPTDRLESFERFVRDAFARGSAPPTRRSIGPRDLAAAGLDRDARPRDLDVEGWVRLFRCVRDPGPA